MALDRRGFLHLAAGAAASGALPGTPVAARRPRFKALAFDGFPVFDPRPVFALAETLFPGRGAALGAAWRTRQFEYQWLRTLGGRYADFLRTTEDALVFAARMLDLDLTAEKRDRLVHAYLELRAWPDARPVLHSLADAGLRLAFCSNMTEEMLRAGIRANDLDGLFEHVLSADRVRAHKPDPRAYAMATDAFGLAREEILFVSFAGWDVAGAKWFGYPVFWVNRIGASAEELAAAADGAGRDLAALASFVLAPG